MRKAIEEGEVLVSDAAFHELADVLGRRKFDAYVSIEERQEFLRQLGRVAELVPIVYMAHECRDPRDNKFLEVGVNGSADLIVSGDEDLLAMHPFRDIPIVTPAAYLKRA